MPTATNGVGTGADDATVGTIAWTTPGNITVDDASYATAILATLNVSHYCMGTMAGNLFNIPNSTTINGIRVKMRRQQTSEVGGAINDNSIKLVKGGTISGNDNSVSQSWNPDVDQSDIFGSTTDLWGLTWTNTDINASNFGAVCSATNGGSATRTGKINYMEISVDYTLDLIRKFTYIFQRETHWAEIYEKWRRMSPDDEFVGFTPNGLRLRQTRRVPTPDI